MRQRLSRALGDRRGGAEIYVLTAFLVWISLALAMAYTVVQGVNGARAAMTRYMQIALQQTADQLGAVNAVSGAQGVTDDAAATLFAQDLANELQGTTWQRLAVTVDQVTVFQASQAGQPAPPGVLGGVIPGPGLYAAVSFPWSLGLPGVPPVTITVPEWMAANVFVQPVQQWNGGGA